MPLGTALGGYTLWFFFSAQGKYCYATAWLKKIDWDGARSIRLWLLMSALFAFSRKRLLTLPACLSRIAALRKTPT